MPSEKGSMLPPPPVFRKRRKKKGRKIRAHVTGDGGPDKGPGDGPEVGGAEKESPSMAEVKLAQKLRRRPVGINSNSLMLKMKEREVVVEEIVAYSEKGGLLEGDEANNVKQNLEGLLDGSFAAQTGTDEKAANPLLEKYVNEKMGLSKPVVEDDSMTIKRKEEEAAVYKMPGKLSAQLQAASEASKQDEFSIDGGPMAFGTGIAEVELPIEFKLKNIEDTEGAKQQMIHKRSGRRQRMQKQNAMKKDDKVDSKKRDFEALNSARDAAPVGSLTANYRHHARSFAQHMRHKRDQRNGGGGGRGGGGPRGFSSDDRVMSRFRKREMNRRR